MRRKKTVEGRNVCVRARVSEKKSEKKKRKWIVKRKGKKEKEKKKSYYFGCNPYVAFKNPPHSLIKFAFISKMGGKNSRVRI